MSPWTLILAGLRHYRRSHLGVLLGAAIGAAALVGALAVGDSVSLSLRAQALERIGRVDVALDAGDRIFRAALADELAPDLAPARIAPALRLEGLAARPDRSARAHQVQVLGVDRRFYELALVAPEPPPPGRGQVLLNERLAGQLRVSVGDTILLRVEQPSAVPRDMVLSTTEDASIGLRVEVTGLLASESLGRFDLAAGQVPPFSAFVDLAWLQDRLDQPGGANLLLAGGGEGDPAELQGAADRALAHTWTLADGQLELLPLTGGQVELRTPRVFLDAPVVDAARGLFPDALAVLTYFVNSLEHGERATPYSMVSGLGTLGEGTSHLGPGSILPAELADDELAINDWLAADLSAAVGDELTLRYFVLGPTRRLVEESETLRVAAVLPLEGAAADPTLMPDFPGLADSENCRDWETGVTVELDRIRDEDEAYWDDHRGTPKAFVSLATAERLWGNRFGTLTAVRFDAGDGLEVSATALRDAIPPASIGLSFRDVRGPALVASNPATDFGGLFLGLSFFLVVAALLLTALLFVFGVEQRASELGLLLAVGFPPARVRRLFLGEAGALALLGSLLGVPLGLLFTRAVLAGLATVWSEAVASAALEFHVRPVTVVLGVGLSALSALASIAITLRGQVARPCVELLSTRAGLMGEARLAARRKTRVALVVAVGAAFGAIVLVTSAGGGSSEAAGAFFGAGALVLISGLAACRILLVRLGSSGGADARPSLAGLSLRNGGRRPGRSLATVALLASGAFLVLSVGANHLGPPGDPTRRDSGTGGFALVGGSSLPVLHDLTSQEGLDAFGLEPEDLAGAGLVQMRLREGDDASCLNLSTPQNPRLVGVRPEQLAERGSFAFADVLGGGDGSPWSLLAGPDPRGEADVVPAIADAASVTWVLRKKLGDTLEYTDERGRSFRVRIVATLAGSILQGDLVIAESAFEQRFPSISGYRLFLIDAPPERSAALSARLNEALEDVGLELTPTAARLAEFNAVQNTYLMVFEALGGLGLLLGSAGLGMVVLRNALERRAELALVRAVGFPSRAVRRLIEVEHLLLLGLGLGLGAVAAALALLPTLSGTGGLEPLSRALLLGAVVALSGYLWVRLATALAARAPLIEALRDE